MHIEIELPSQHSTDDVYALRNYLQEQLPDLNIKLKELPAEQGQMVVVSIAGIIVEGIIEAVAGETVHELYNRLLRPQVMSWLHARKKDNAPDLEVLSTVKTNETKVHFSQSSSGESKIYENVNYAIDTDKTRAILIGSSEFDSSFNPIPPVHGNLQDLSSLLTDKRHIGLPAENVVVAYNKSSSEIEELLLHHSRKPDTDTLLIYYAGHGHRSDVKKLYLIARNTKKIDDYILGGIDLDFIQNVVLKSSSAKQKILILDACHSGIATQGSGSLVAEIDVKGTYILTSSPGDEVSYFDKNGRNTYFTGVLIDVLKNGIENTNEMLALDDLYDYAQDHLQQKNFPHPISKSQLNIPASQFFIARNPSFSVEKNKRRASLLFQEGRAQDALYEYEFLLKKYPDDLELRKEAEACKSEVLFTQLVSDADELFHVHQNYAAALSKYKKALTIRSDNTVVHKVRRCEERIRPDAIVTPPPRKEMKDIQTEPLSPEKRKDEPIPPKPKPPVKDKVTPVPPEKIEKPTSVPAAPARSGFNAVGLSLVWLLIVIVLVAALFESAAIYTVVGMLAIVSVVLIIIRGRKMRITELLAYTFSLGPPIFLLGTELSRNDDTLILGVLISAIPAYWFYRQWKKKINAFSLVQIIIATVLLIGLVSFATGMIIYSIGEGLFESYVSGDYAIAGLVLGAIAGIILSIILIGRWHPARKPPSPDSPA